MLNPYKKVYTPYPIYICRGGGFSCSMWSTRSSYRNLNNDDYYSKDGSFRIVFNIK